MPYLWELMVEPGRREGEWFVNLGPDAGHNFKPRRVLTNRKIESRADMTEFLNKFLKSQVKHGNESIANLVQLAIFKLDAEDLRQQHVATIVRLKNQLKQRRGQSKRIADLKNEHNSQAMDMATLRQTNKRMAEEITHLAELCKRACKN